MAPAGSGAATGEDVAGASTGGSVTGLVGTGVIGDGVTMAAAVVAASNRFVSAAVVAASVMAAAVVAASVTAAAVVAASAADVVAALATVDVVSAIAGGAVGVPVFIAISIGLIVVGSIDGASVVGMLMDMGAGFGSFVFLSIRSSKVSRRCISSGVYILKTRLRSGVNERAGAARARADRDRMR